MVLSFIYCIIGFILLSYAADKLVEGASNLAINIGVSKTVIGLTIVAAGTSLPEMVVSVNASLKGNPALSLGNLVGSNIMNAAFILGIAALIYPIKCERQMVRREVPIMIGTALLLWYVAHTDGYITPTEGMMLFALLFAYTGLSYYWSRKESTIAAEMVEKCDLITEATEKDEMPTTKTNIIYILVGLVGLVIGSEVLVKGAVEIAKILGLSDEIIGLTLIAIGTSLPELATSIVAARKGHSEITLGNVVGSNIFNVLGIVGCASAVSWFNPTPETQVLMVSPNMLGIHIPLMVVVSLGVLPIMSTGMRIIRAEGALLVAVYLAYNVILFQTSSSTVPIPELKKDIPAQMQPKNLSTPANNSLLQIPATATENIGLASQTEAATATEKLHEPTSSALPDGAGKTGGEPLQESLPTVSTPIGD
ncbi:MAG: calcium/sodium antiporter [Candidatus Riflebacteria bacterium]|nr:calcium/sodium antiporter [Candidatus Riflebacteria bacterium]